MNRKNLYKIIRDEVMQAAVNQALIGPFNLLGRGHEPRVTLDRQLAAILRDCALPKITITGYGANNFYPARVFQEAALNLEARLSWTPMMFGTGCVGFVEVNESITQSQPSPKWMSETLEIVSDIQIQTEKSKSDYRKVFVVVKHWPDGTEAQKIGHVIAKGLRIKTDQLKLIQVGPERIFSTVTQASLYEFLKTLANYGLGSNSNVSIFDESSDSGMEFSLLEKLESSSDC